MEKKIRRSLVRTYVRIAAKKHKHDIVQNRSITSTMATDIINNEPYGPSKGSYAACLVTAGLHLPVEIPLRRKWQRDKLLLVSRGLAFRLMDAYITSTGQEEGMIPTVATIIREVLRRKDATFVENELDKAVDIDDRLNADEIEYLLAMTAILKELARAGIEINVDTVATEARRKLQKMAGENVTIEFENGGGLRQVEYRENKACLCMRNIERNETITETKTGFERDSTRTVLEVAAEPEGSPISLRIGSIKAVHDVFRIEEKEVKTVVAKTDLRSPWEPLRYLSDIDGSRSQSDCTARAWYLILNHSLPNKFSFRESNLSWAFRPSEKTAEPNQRIEVDLEVSPAEMKCSPLELQVSTDSRGKEWIHPIGTKLSISTWGKTRLVWNGRTKFINP